MSCQLCKRGDKFIFLTVGRLVPVKNIGLQIRATTEVIKKYQNVEFWIVGDGSERKKLENEALKFGVKNNVKFWAGKIIRMNFILKLMHFCLHQTMKAEAWWQLKR